MSNIDRRSEAANHWIETILAERYGHQWSINYVDEKLVLELRNSVGKIIFDRLEHGFAQDNFSIGCAYCNVEREGWISALSSPIPAPGSEFLEKPLIEKNGADYIIHYDILGLVYWMLARIEEIGRLDLDKFDRFPSTSSHAYRYNYLDRPLVDEWLEVLRQVIILRWKNIELKVHKFQIILSHDVDRPFRYLFTSSLNIFKQCTADIVKRQSLRLSIDRYLTWQSVRKGGHITDPYYTFDWIMDQSEKNGLRSTFYFICGVTNKEMDADYQIDSPVMHKLLRKIHDRGHQIGLHPSYETYRMPEDIKQEFERLRSACSKVGMLQNIWGGRMHYLRWEQESTLIALSDAGLNYDSTLGYADQPGFRCGTCFEYPAFDATRNKMLELRIRPLIAMDTSIFTLTNYDFNSAFKILKKLKQTCKRVNGNFELLWHNSELYSEDLRNIYRSILAFE